MSFSLIVRSMARKVIRPYTPPNALNLFRITHHQYTLALLHVLEVNRVYVLDNQRDAVLSSLYLF